MDSLLSSSTAKAVTLYVGRSLILPRCHRFPQTERPHVRPHLIDISQAFGLSARLPSINPTGRDFTISRPNGKLLFVVDHHPIHYLVIIFEHTHLLSLHVVQIQITTGLLNPGRQTCHSGSLEELLERHVDAKDHLYSSDYLHG